VHETSLSQKKSTKEPYEKSTSYAQNTLATSESKDLTEQQCKFKILISTFNIVNTESNSENMISFIEKTITPYDLRKTNSLGVPKVKTTTHG
jgi:hypothetical protein